jgi:oxygen-independent coproporphyrinogen-3 oxidase
MAGIYIHIPFCKKACIYCDFHFSTSLKNKENLIKNMLKEIELRKNYLLKETIETIYFGGGTPSLLNQDEINTILETIKKHHTVNKKAEITLEANPDDLTIEKLTALKQAGINRLSIGLQSFLKEELNWMNRTHSSKQNETCILDAKQVGFNNINVDLIYGSRFQSERSWEETLKKIEKLDIQHLSCYNLTVEEKTVFGALVKKKKENEVDEELSVKQFETLMNWSAQFGFDQYEISNFCKKGFLSKHNSAYWLGKNYLGIGPSAHSYNIISRQWNISNNALYIKNITANENYFESEKLNEKTKLNEYILTRIRTKWGIEITYIKANFTDILYSLVVKNIELEKEAKNLIETNGIITLTLKGKILGDEVTRNLIV